MINNFEKKDSKATKARSTKKNRCARHSVLYRIYKLGRRRMKKHFNSD